ncbi:hypothetical protein GCM10010885_12460 [Alicyclobacillus cellulosilyticus]|uniref:SLH domain-containing protein n=1 Tax=Alicyclobacillus cellulosilyticus TaxID=1003997 RepID=A0A917K8Q3_9BACL|nr:YcdB/YcdC domain-containing protein [Alicyclobacillus cellulosilyticus]GGJ04815.1 hypothetical protein GCM10010885_12460 [Alicyclobacillus cellulosilyticus]
MKRRLGTGAALCILLGSTLTSPAAFAATSVSHHLAARVHQPTTTSASHRLAAGKIAGAKAKTDPAVKPKLSLDDARRIVETTFAIPSTFTLQNESYNSDPSGAATYTLYYVSSDPATPQASINAQVDANTGRIISYARNYPGSNRFVFPVPTTADQAQQTAIQWVQKLYPDQYGSLKLQPLTPQPGPLQGPIQYTFTFTRMVNGIPAPFDGVSVTIDQNGRLVSVNDNWTDLPFPDPGKAIGQADANRLYNQALQIHLAYNQVWKGGGASAQTELVYVQDTEGRPVWWTGGFTNQQVAAPVLNALTGQVVDATGQAYTPAPYQVPKPIDPNGPVKPLPWNKVNWTQDHAQSYAQSVLSIPSGAKLQTVYQYQGAGSDTTWSFSWLLPDGSQVNASVDATYGFLQSYSNSNLVIAMAKSAALIASGQASSAGATAAPAPASKPAPPTQQQILDAATAFVRKVFAGDTGAVAVLPQPVYPGKTNTGLTTGFQVQVFANGIPDMELTGYVQVDANTGQVANFWFSTNNLGESLPNPRLAVAADQAKQTWMQAQPLQLVYLKTEPTPVTQPGGTSTAPQVILAWAPMYPAGSDDVFNAVTGQFESTGVPAPYAGPIQDLNGVAAAPQIQLLVQRELIPVDSGGYVHPTQAMTNAAFVKLLVDALGQQYRYDPLLAQSAALASALSRVPAGSPAYNEIAVAYELGWIPADVTFAPDEPVTRTFAAQILARALNFAPLLAHPEALNLPAADVASIPDDAYAACALAYALGLFPLQDNQFNPGGPVTLADAAVAVVQAAVVYGEEGGGSFPGPRPLNG